MVFSSSKLHTPTVEDNEITEKTVAKLVIYTCVFRTPATLIDCIPSNEGLQNERLNAALLLLCIDTWRWVGLGVATGQEARMHASASMHYH